MADKWSTLFAPKAAKGDMAGSPADAQARARYLASLHSPAPAQWTSSHLAEDMRLTGAVYVAVKVLCDQAASAEAGVFRVPKGKHAADPDAREPVEPDHALATLLRRPNTQETMGGLLRRMTQQISLTGTALGWRVDDDYEPREVWSVPTGTYQPVAPGGYYPQGAYRIQPYFPGPFAMMPGMGLGGVIVPAEQMIAARYPHPLLPAHEGYSPLNACALPLDTIEMIDRSRASRVRRGANVSAAVELDPGMSWPDGDGMTRLRAEIQQLLGGPDKAGGIGILGPGMKLNQVSSDNVEVGWIESWGQLVSFVLSVFGVTKSLAFMSEETTFAALYATLKQFDLFTLCPLLQLIADAINISLVWPFYGEEYFVELKPKKITDEDAVAKKVQLAASVGAITKNEVRIALDWEPTKEAWGEEPAVVAKVSEKGDVDRSGSIGGAGGPAGGGNGKPPEERGEPAEVAKGRDKNPQGRGSLGDRKPLAGAGKSNGHAGGGRW